MFFVYSGMAITKARNTHSRFSREDLVERSMMNTSSQSWGNTTKKLPLISILRRPSEQRYHSLNIQLVIRRSYHLDIGNLKCRYAVFGYPLSKSYTFSILLVLDAQSTHSNDCNKNYRNLVGLEVTRSVSAIHVLPIGFHNECMCVPRVVPITSWTIDPIAIKLGRVTSL